MHLVFGRRRLTMSRIPFESTAVLLVALACACTPNEPPAEPPANLLLISIDTLRADHLSCYGYARETSPNLDRLAAGGVRFESCFSPTSWTLPAHLSLLTGLAISVHGIDDERLWDRYAGDGPGQPAHVPLIGTFLSEHLTRAGFLSAGYYSWKFLEPQFGFGPGFRVWERVGRTLYARPADLERFARLRRAGNTEALEEWERRDPLVFDLHQPGDDLVIDRGLEFFKESRGAAARRFLFLHLFDPHEDYVPPPPFDTRFTDRSYSGPIDGRGVSSTGSKIQLGMPAADLEHLIALYDGEIAWSDAQVGRLLDELERTGELADTLVSVTSDHGEEFFEHGGKSHRGNLFAESTRVPWLLHHPSGLPAGQVVEGATGLVDVMPTVMALLGLEVPVGLSGTDLSAVARSSVPNAERPYTQLLWNFSQTDEVPVRKVGLRTGNQVLLWDARGAETLRTSFYGQARGALEAGAPTATDWEAIEVRALRARLDEVRSQYWMQREANQLRILHGKQLRDSDRVELEALGYVSSEPASLEEPPESLLHLPIDGGAWFLK